MLDQNLKPYGNPKGLINRGFATVVMLVELATLLVTTLTACNLPSPKKTAGPSILTSILSPQMGDVVDISQPIEISATSACNDGITRLEFYVDGVPVATQNTTLPEGSNPLFLSSLWTPQTAVQHVLMARGYTKDNRFSDSSVVFVSVNAQPAPRVLKVDELPRPEGAPLPSLNDLADKSGLAVSELVNANPALSGTDPKAPLPPGTSLVFPPAPTAGVAGGPSATATPMPTAGVPSGAPAPGGPTGLTVTADCNSAQLSWNDRPDEEQYVVYRISPGSTSLSPIATLPANTTSYRDNLLGPGVYFYQVASRRGGQESLSQMVSAQPPNTCPAPTPPSTTTDLTLTVVDLETTEPFEGAFCYVTFSDGGSTRYPFSQYENFQSVAGDPRLYSFRAVPFTLSHYAAWPLNRPFSAHVECLGVTRSYAPSLGSININRRPSDWDGRLLTDSSTNGRQGNFTLRYCLSIMPGRYCRDISYGSAPSSSNWSEADIRPGVIHDGPAPYNLRLEPDNWQGCVRRFMGGGPSPAQDIARCLHDAIRYGATLQWEWQEQPPNFMAADLIGFHVTLGRQSILTHEELSRQERDVSLWEMFYPAGRAIDYYYIRDFADHSPSSCSMAYAYSVEAVFSGGRRSPPSLSRSFTTDPCFLPADVVVNFDTLTINEGAVDQGDWCVICLNDDTTFELRGNIEVVSGSHNWSREINTPLVSGGTLFMDSTDVVHVTDPHQTITINVSVYDYDEPTPLAAAAYEPTIPCTMRFELPAGTTEHWRHTHLHLIDSCDYPGVAENLTFTVVLSVDGPP